MLIVTANWRMTDGSLAEGPTAGFVHRWRIGAFQAMLRAGIRRDGSYRPVAGVDLVFAGDTFDWLVSSEWLGEMRPWHRGRRAAGVLERVAGRSVGCGRRLFATLVAWSRRGVIVPEADRHGRPSMSAVRRVPVRVAFLGGDRDEQIEHVVGRWVTERGLGVGRVWSTTETSIRHGHESDPLCDTSLGRPTLAESLAVDLITRFAAEAAANADVGPRMPALVRWLSGGSPAGAASRLAAWLLAGGATSGTGACWRQSLIDTWNRQVVRWHRVARRLPPRGDAGIDVVDCLAESLELGGGGLSKPVWTSSRASSLRVSAAAAIVGHAACGLGVFGPSSSSARGDLGGLPRGHVAEEDLMPSSGIVRFGREGLVLDPLAIEPRTWPTSATDCEEDRCVWISGGPGHCRGVVDAA